MKGVDGIGVSPADQRRDHSTQDEDGQKDRATQLGERGVDGVHARRGCRIHSYPELRGVGRNRRLPDLLEEPAAKGSPLGK